MGNCPILSVIVPVRNAETTLKRCVESILAQTAAFAIEIVLVENGSDDNSLAVCEQLAKSHSEIRVLVSRQIGVSEARNLGVVEAKAQCITFVDADDYIDADMYRCMMDAKNKHGVRIVSCNFINEFADGTTQHQFPDTGNIMVKDAADAAYDVLMDTYSSSSPCIRIFDREFLLSRKFPERVRFEDHAVMFEWVENGGQTVHIDTPFYHYCHHTASYTSDLYRNPIKIRDYFHAEQKRMRFIKTYPHFSDRQRKTALRKSLRSLFLAVKRLARFVPQNSKMEQELLAIRDEFVDELSRMSPITISLSNYLKYLKIRYCWKTYRRKQQHKLRRMQRLLNN